MIVLSSCYTALNVPASIRMTLFFHSRTSVRLLGDCEVFRKRVPRSLMDVS